MKRLFIILIFPIFLFASKSILIINSYHKGYKFSDEIVRGIDKVLNPYSLINVDVLYMDSKRVTTKEYYDSLKSLYKIQLRKRKYDLIITIDRFAYDFLLGIYNDFFDKQPILTVGIENFSYEKAKKYGVSHKVSALIEKRDLAGNVRTIKKLLPSLKKLYVINDKSLNGMHTEPLIKNLIKNFHGNYQLIYLKENNLKELEKKFSKKEEDSAALFIRFYKNKNGKLNKIVNIEKFIKNAKIPIFVTDSIFIKKGATGGKVVDLYRFGQSSGNMALDILEGYSSNIKINYDFYYIFDSKKLAQFSLPVNVLPHSYELVNKRKTFYDKNRGFINLVFTISPFLILLILGLIHNIYMRKQVQKDLIRRVEFDKVLLNAIDSPIFWQDESGNVVESNSKFCALLNISCQKVYGKKLEDFNDNADVLFVLDVLKKYKSNKNDNHEFKYFDGYGRKKIYLVKQEKFKDLNSKKEGYVTIFTDVTKEREISIEKQRNRQFVIQQSKLAEIGEIFSSIAHQWKAPLVEITAIAQELFYTRKLKNTKEDEGFVKDIMNQVTYMTNTINDFQKFIMPSNKNVDFDIKEAIDAMLQIINHNIKYNGIKILISIEKNTNLIVNGYKNEFMQSFLNIINNAKDALLDNDYKDRKIEIKVFNRNGGLYITIKDNAGGIKNKIINKIFEPYYTTKNNGHGIGLYMTKVIIEDKMGGKIYVKNINRGVMFTIKLRQNNENIST